MGGTTTGGEAGLRRAEQELAAALASPDPLAWVGCYTEDAVFDAGRAVVGREALLGMASAMRQLRDVVIRPLRTEIAGDLACVWSEASWTSGDGDDSTSVEVRGILVWRRDDDGSWRVAMEHIS